MGIWSDLFQLFFPALCTSCSSKLVDGEKFICLKCLHALPKTGYALSRDNPLEVLFSGRLPFERIASFAYFSKEGTVQKIMHELKYGNNPELGEFLGALIYREWKSTGFFDTIDGLVPVPLHAKRLKKRGYNQSFHLAKGIADASGISLLSGNLLRTVNNPSQTTLSSTERWSNVDGIFSIRDASAFEGKHVLLMDDVLTTGSTIESCAKQILTCARARISICTFGSVM